MAGERNKSTCLTSQCSNATAIVFWKGIDKMIRKNAAIRGLLLLAAALALISTLPCTAQANPIPSIAPVNPAYLDYLRYPNLAAQSVAPGDYPGGLVPEPFTLPSIAAPRVATVLPATYDLRALGKLTAIRDQGSCGSCWDFATMGSLESSLMPTESANFSENNLKNLSGFDIGCCSGGNRAMSTAYLARWAGPVNETDDPYYTGNCTSVAGSILRKHVQDIIFLPNRTTPLGNDAIKQAVMNYGAVYTSYYHSDSYYNSANAAYYYSGSSQSNHAVCIVGWDDNYAATRFRTAPPGNGAFLIRNSWGTWWGMSGYFWMSYYDSVLGKTENAVFTAAPVTNYDQVYQYDPLGWISSTGYGSNTAWFANVFTATANGSVAAASWYCPAPNSGYTLYVYTNPTSGPISSAGPATSASGTIATAGYHTAQLPTSVPIVTGQRFSVVVRLTTPGYNYPICMERPYSGYASGATASLGQSYMSNSGTSWTDVAGYYSNTNVCLKAFTVSSGAPPPTAGALSVTPITGLASSGVVGGMFSPASQTYTLTNTGGAAINWTAGATKAWIGVSSLTGTLAAGASTTVTVSINATAKTLAAGSYTDTVSFTNTTNGVGNTVRGVSLTVSSAAPPPVSGAYQVIPTTYSWIDSSGHTSIALSDDSVSAAQNLSFTFTYYGKPYTKIYIGSNGLLGFTNSGMYAYANYNIPSTALPNAAIYPYWDDLNPAGGSVRVGTVGASPNRKTVVSWVGVAFYASSVTKLTFQAILCEGSNDIVFQYQNAAPTSTIYGAGANATVGIENETGTQACKFSYNSRSLSNSLAIRFTTLPTGVKHTVARY